MGGRGPAGDASCGGVEHTVYAAAGGREGLAVTLTQGLADPSQGTST
jgi:hypothetical protein